MQAPITSVSGIIYAATVRRAHGASNFPEFMFLSPYYPSMEYTENILFALAGFGVVFWPLWFMLIVLSEVAF
jgi:hypothetical protein